jgi:hypothetical protein
MGLIFVVLIIFKKGKVSGYLFIHSKYIYWGPMLGHEDREVSKILSSHLQRAHADRQPYMDGLGSIVCDHIQK